MTIPETDTQPTPDDDRPETSSPDDTSPSDQTGPVTGKTHPGVITDDRLPRHDADPDAIADSQIDPERPQ